MGVSYVFRSWDDFFPEDDLLFGRKFGGGGFYTSGDSDYLAATFDLPPGASLHDLEWYVSNTAAMTVYANIWQSSQAILDSFWSTTSGGVLRGGQSRTVSLAGHIPAGALGAIVNIEVNGTVGTGFPKLYAAGTPTPSTSAINWFADHQTMANQATTAVNLARAVTITAGGLMTAYRQFIIDVVGYLV